MTYYVDGVPKPRFFDHVTDRTVHTRDWKNMNPINAAHSNLCRRMDELRQAVKHYAKVTEEQDKDVDRRAMALVNTKIDEAELWAGRAFPQPKKD